MDTASMTPLVTGHPYRTLSLQLSGTDVQGAFVSPCGDNFCPYSTYFFTRAVLIYFTLPPSDGTKATLALDSRLKDADGHWSHCGRGATLCHSSVAFSVLYDPRLPYS